MPGLTQQDVTPVVPQEESGADKEQKDQGYQWMRWITKPGNELQHLGNQVTDFVKRRNANVQSTGNVGILRIYTEKDQPGVIKTGALPVEREGTQGVVEATANVGLAGVNLGQNIVEQVVAPIQGREPEAQDPEETLLGRPLAGLKEASADFLDLPQRYELPESDRLLRDVSGEVAVATALGLLIGKTPLNPLGSSTSFTGTKLNPLVSPGLKDLVNTRGPLAAAFRNQNVARLRPLLRWGSAIGVESMLTTAVTDNRETAWADPGDDQTRAALKALIPQAGFDFALAGGLFGIGKGVEKAFQLPELFQSIARNKKAQNTVNDVGKARTWAEESGFQQQNGEGAYEFIADDPWGTGPVSDAEVSTAFDQPSKAAPAPKNPREAINQMVGSGDRDIPDIWDASLPEVDVAIRGLDQLDDEGLTAIANRPSDQPIAEALGEQLNRQQQMRQAQEQLRQVAEARSQQRGFRADVAEEAPAAPELEVAPEAPVMETPQAAIPEQEMFEAIDVLQLQKIAALDVNVGAELAKVGTSPVKATRRELIDAILRVRQKNAGVASPIQAPPSAMPAAQRNEVKKQVIRQAINNGEVRPSATEAPELPTPTNKDLDDMTPLEALDEELRLKDEYQKLDNAKAERIINETREAEGYYQMSPEEQVANGKLDGWEEPPAQPRAEFVIPKDLSKSAPRFGRAKLEFESDLDRAAYMIRNKTKKSKGEDRMIAALKEQGYDIDEIRALGDEVKTQIQDGIQEVTGSRRAPQEELTIQVPRSGDGEDSSLSSIYFHGTDASNVPSIDAEGLKAAEVQLYGPGVYLTSDKDAAKWHRVNRRTGNANAVYALDVADEDVVRVEPRPSGDAKDQWRREIVKLREEGKSVLIPGSDYWGDMLIVDEATAKGAKLSSLDLPDVPERPALPMEERVAKAVSLRVEQLEADLIGVAKQVFGDDLPDFKFRAEKKRTITPKEWGGDGTGYSTQNAAYTFGGIQDLITVNNLRNRPLAELRSSMFHESWHRIQRGYLKPKELKILDNVFAQRDLANWANMRGGQKIKQVEVQAVAFQNYSALRDRGMTRMDLIREGTIAELEKAFPGLKGWKKKLTVNAFTAIAEGWERIRGFSSRARNLIESNGYQNVYDLFEEAYDGRLTKNRRFEDAARAIDEVLGMSDNQVEYLVNTGKIEEVNASFDAAIERDRYFRKWKGKANTVLNSIDTEIAAFKQLATEGGC